MTTSFKRQLRLFFLFNQPSVIEASASDPYIIWADPDPFVLADMDPALDSDPDELIR